MATPTKISPLNCWEKEFQDIAKKNLQESEKTLSSKVRLHFTKNKLLNDKVEESENMIQLIKDQLQEEGSLEEFNNFCENRSDSELDTLHKQMNLCEYQAADFNRRINECSKLLIRFIDYIIYKEKNP